MSVRSDRGFGMVAVVLALLVTAAISAAAFAAANGDIGLTRVDQDEKRALAAAEAGIGEYLYHLNEDNSYWTYCDEAPAPAPINRAWDGNGPEPAWEWRQVPGSAARYKIEILPAPGYAACVRGTDASAIDAETGVLRIRVTGESRGRRRTMVASLRRTNFLDFLYFTDHETSDPAQYEINVDGFQTRNPEIMTWASQQCDRQFRENRRWDQNGNTIYWAGEVYRPNLLSWVKLTGGYAVACTNINFVGGDQVRGPFHTNDEFYVCNGNPIFGRSRTPGDGLPRDRVEYSGPGWFSCGGGAAPDFGNNFATPRAPELELPPSNTELKAEAAPEYRFRGHTTITFQGDHLLVTNPLMGLLNATYNWPENGVIYVEHNTLGLPTCGQGYQVLNPYAASDGCGDVEVSGTYTRSLTIAAEKDVIIRGNVVNGDDALLGLIANNFVRIYHPITDQLAANRCAGLSGPTGTVPGNAPGTMTNVQIDAAILSLNHVFTVDNYQCGAKLGTLTVNGVIAQKFRGPVGTGSATTGTGYTKDYRYDDRMKFRTPPHFLEPVQSAWHVARETEQTPAR